MGEYAPLSSYSLVSMEHEPACLRDSLDFSRFFSFSYGDRAPVTYYGRLFSVFWILMGLVIIGILNGSITTAITAFSVNFDFSLYGKTVGNLNCLKNLFFLI